MNPLLTGLLNLPGVVVEDFQQAEKDLVLKVEQEDKALSETVFPPKPPFKISKPEIRTSLRALTTEAAFATVFSRIIGGALLSNFLLDLGASTVEIGLLASIPQLTNLLQPLGAYLGDRIKSRNWYSLWIFGTSRLLWLIIVPGIWLVSSSRIQPHQLVGLTLFIDRKSVV